MTREDLTNWRKKHSLRQEDLAQLLGIARVSVTRWENGTRKIPPFLHWALESISSYLKGGETGKAKTRKRKPKGKEVKKHGKSLSKR